MHVPKSELQFVTRSPRDKREKAHDIGQLMAASKYGDKERSFSPTESSNANTQTRPQLVKEAATLTTAEEPDINEGTLINFSTFVLPPKQVDPARERLRRTRMTSQASAASCRGSEGKRRRDPTADRLGHSRVLRAAARRTLKAYRISS